VAGPPRRGLGVGRPTQARFTEDLPPRPMLRLGGDLSPTGLSGVQLRLKGVIPSREQCQKVVISCRIDRAQRAHQDTVMIRFALLLSYLSAVFSGPQSCCCATTPPGPPTAPTKEHGCPLCPAEEKPEQNRSLPAQKHHCPCPKAELKATLPPRTGDDTRQESVTDSLPPEYFSQSTLAGAGRVIHQGLLRDPFLHLPFLCQRLRC
jgi:hypothetical protein